MVVDKFYTRDKLLGAGSFSITYLCKKIASKRNYACKYIQKSKLITKNEQENVQREVDIMMLLNLKKHPNIVSIKETMQDDDYKYIVMELCEGGTLFNRIYKQGSLSETKAAKIIREIIRAIQTCHKNGIVHRDLKLDNVLFKTKHEDSKLKVADFGLSRFFKPGEAFTDVVGSPGYLAPEVWTRHHGPKADIWSAGVILYILLSGYMPFSANTFEETYYDIMFSNALCFEEDEWLGISNDAKDLVKRMLKINVNERFNALEVLKHPWIRKNAK